MPVAGEPVMEIPSTPGLLIRALPTLGPAPWITFTTPVGRTSFMISAIRNVANGVSSDGLSTTGQPAASGAASFHDAIISG